MKRLLLLAAIAAVTVVAAAGYSAWTREQAYQRLVSEGEAAAAAGDALTSIEALSGAIALRPDSMVAWLRRGEMYHLQQDYGAAVRDLRRAAELDPSAPRPEEQIGDVYLERRLYRSAAEHYAQASLKDDRAHRVLYKLGLASLRDGHLDRAVQALTRASALEPRHAETHYLLGLCLAQQGNATGAIDALERALAIDASMLAAREAAVPLYASLARFPDALRQLETLARLEPERPERVAAVALALSRTGRADEAVVALARAAKRFPDNPLLLETLGRVWLDVGLAGGDRVALMKAVEALRRSAERAPGGGNLGLLGRARLALGDRAQALRTLESATSYLPVSTDTLEWLAEAAESQGRVLAARDALLKADALAGDAASEKTRGQRARRIGLLSLRAGDARTAATWLERAVALLPQDADLRKQAEDARKRVGSGA